MTREDKHYIELLQQKANKPKHELIEILDELEKMEGTTGKSQRLESIIGRLEAWQNC